MASENGNAGNVQSLRQRILEAKDIDRETVPVERWGVELEVRGMSGTERASLMRNATDAKGRVDYAALYPELLIACCYDPESGEKVFGPADRDALNGKSAGALEEVGRVALRLSGLGEQAGAVVAKN